MIVQPTPVAPGGARKVALAAWVGSALEYYDFFIYGTAAALVFGRIFFPASEPAAGTLLALATFGVGYLARPLGALVLGHVGDVFGRKRVLVLTLVLMGLTTFLVGCLPTYDQIGVAAPVLLVALRLLQGFSVAGEQAGANSMALEHAPPTRRAYYTSFTLNGTQAGQIIATAAFLPVAALPEEHLLSWGWRVPFWLSAAVAVVGLVIRRALTETPVFEGTATDDRVHEPPLALLLRNHWADVLRVVAASLIASVSTIFTVHALSYAVNTVGLERAPLLWVGVLANVTAMAAIPLWALLADRIGRRPVLIGGALGCAVLIFAYLGSIAAGNYPLVILLGILLFGVVYSATNGVWPAFYGEMFPTRVRLSGMAVGTQIGFAIAGLAPAAATALAGTGRESWLGVSAFTAALCLVHVVAVATGRETHRIPTPQLGLGRSPVPAAPDTAGTAGPDGPERAPSGPTGPVRHPG